MSLHKRITRSVTSAFKSEESFKVDLVFYNQQTRTLRVIYQSGAGYDYYNVDRNAAQMIKRLSNDPRVNLREALKDTYKRERLESKVSKAIQLSGSILSAAMQQEIDW